jgi:hypothetical protein
VARQGSFSGGLNPFGTGTLGGLSQYEIGADLADLEVYKVEVAWGNGLATDAEYLAALQKAVNATDPNTRRRETATNKLDDANYRIGRSLAEEKGLDELIAFDQAAIAKMKPESERYRTVKSSLDSELAARRSRDYGRLVDDYNAGKTSTQSLLTWVSNALNGLDEDDPDFDNWTGVKADLSERILDEKDAKVYQDYQQGRMKAPAFLAYLEGRLDAYEPGSPQYNDFSRRLEDAREQVKDTEQSKKDQAFFNRYELGKVSDKSYLSYLKNRIKGMDSDDPQKPEWQHRLKQASFSLAEDKLRFDVEKGKAPVSRLISFYRSYRNGLNPGSAEWRTITRALDNLRGYTGGGGGGGGGGGSRSSGGGGGGTSGSKYSATSAVGPGPKLISPKYTLDNILGLFTIDPSAGRSPVASAKKFLALNMASIGNAIQRGDDVWLFHDPRKPGATVPGKNPDGSPMLDRNGKPVMVRGSAYLPSTNEAYANLLQVEAGNYQYAAEWALANKKYGDYAYNLRRAAETLDKARMEDGQARAQQWDDWYKQTTEAVEHLTRQGLYGEAVKLATDMAKRLAGELGDPYLDETRRDKIDRIGERLANNPLLPTVDKITGKVIPGALGGSGQLMPGWHHVLKSNDSGQADYGPVYDDKQDGSWEAEHVTVHTTYGGKVVTGETKRKIATTAPVVVVRTDRGWQSIPLTGQTEFISFQNEDGQTTKAYSLDGQTWISPGAGAPAPMVEINGMLTQRPDGSGGTLLVDAEGKTVFAQPFGGAWEPNTDYFTENPDARSWYGEKQWRARPVIAKNVARVGGDLAKIGRQTEKALGFNPLGGISDIIGAASKLLTATRGKMDVGGPGVQMTLIDTSRSGVVNLTSPDRYGPNSRVTEQQQAQNEKFRIRDIKSGKAATGRLTEQEKIRREQLAARGLRSGLPDDTPPRFEGSGLRPVAKAPANRPIKTFAPAVAVPARAATQTALRATTVVKSVTSVLAKVAPPKLKTTVKPLPPKPKPKARPTPKPKPTTKRPIARRPPPKKKNVITAAKRKPLYLNSTAKMNSLR